MHSPQPLHSSVSTRSVPRSRLAGSVIGSLLFAIRSGQHGGRFALEIMRAHGKVLEFLLKARIGDADERFGAFPQGFAVEIRDAVLGDDVMNISARGDDAGAGFEHGNDARDFAGKRGGGEGNDGNSAAGARRAADEV